MSWEVILNISILLLGGASVVIPSVSDIKKPAGIRSQPDRKIFTTMGKIFMFTVIMMTVLTGIKFALDLNSEKEHNKVMNGLRDGNTALLIAHTADSTNQLLRDERCKREAAEERLELKLLRDSLSAQMNDNTNKTIERIAQSDSTKEVLPTLTIFELPTLSKPQNEWLFTYILESLNADAHVLGYQYLFVPFKGMPIESCDTPFSVLPQNLDFTTVIAKDQPNGLMIFLDRVLSNKPDSFAVVIEIYYKSKSNKRLVPLRKVYLVDYVNKKVMLPGSINFMKISLYLKKLKIWKKFYDL